MKKCPVCGYDLGDLTYESQVEVHLQRCALVLQLRIDESLARIADRLDEAVVPGLLMRREGRVAQLAPERFQNGGE